MVELELDKDIVTNDSLVLLLTIIISCNRTRTKVDISTDFRISNIGQMTSLEYFRQLTIL